MVLILEGTFDNPIRVARRVFVNPEELAVAKQHLSQAQHGHADGGQGQPAHQAFDVVHIPNPLHQDQEQQRMGDERDQAAARRLRRQCQLVPDTQLCLRIGLRRPQRQQTLDLRRQDAQHARRQRRQLQHHQQYARHQDPFQAGPAPAGVRQQALPHQPADGREADQRDVDQAADIAPPAHEQRRDENHAHQAGVNEP